jgi:hypothetical protein
VIEGVYLDLELFDQGKQTEFVHVPERFGQYKFLIHRPVIGWSDKGVMKVGNRGDVPRVTSQGAREETVCIADKMYDDHFNDLLGKYGGGRVS